MSQAASKLTIVINALTDLAPLYGSRVYLFGLARALSQLPTVNLILLVGDQQAKQLPVDLRHCATEVRVPIHRSYWQILFASRINRNLRYLRTAVYHLPNTLPVGAKSTPTVITIHDLADLRVPKYGRARTWYRRWVNYMAVRRADHVLTVSLNSKRDIVEMLNVAEHKVSVVYPGVEERFRPFDIRDCKDYVAMHYGLPREFLLAPGGLARNKNVDGLLRAVVELRRLGCNQPLVCTGHVEPRERRHINQVIDRLNLTGGVILTGHIPEADMPKLYNASSAVVYPSLYEGFGFPVLEAMACGVPVVASEGSSIPEVAGNAAQLVDPRNPAAVAEALKRVLNDANLRRELSARGLERAREFSWQRTALQTLAVYAKVMRPRESSPYETWPLVSHDESFHRLSDKRV